MIDLDNLTRKFILNEGNTAQPSIQSFCESLYRLFEMIRPSSSRDRRLIEIMKQQLKEVKNGVKRLTEEIKTLQEQISILEEKKSKK